MHMLLLSESAEAALPQEYMTAIYVGSGLLVLILAILFCCTTQPVCAVIDAALGVVCFNSCCKCCTRSVPSDPSKVTPAWLTAQLEKENMLPPNCGRRVTGITPKFLGELEKGMTSECKLRSE